jgi:hypothetical protein
VEQSSESAGALDRLAICDVRCCLWAFSLDLGECDALAIKRGRTIPDAVVIRDTEAELALRRRGAEWLNGAVP